MANEHARTLLIFAHPALERARLNPVLLAAVADLPGVTVRDLYELYPDFAVDVPEEHRLLAEHDLIVLQFPLYWYAAPALLKEWVDVVWLPGFAYGAGGGAMAGKTLMCAVTTGSGEESYAGFSACDPTLEDFLLPWAQAARLAEMRWSPPFSVHAATLLSDGVLAAEAARYRERLIDLARTTRRGPA